MSINFIMAVKNISRIGLPTNLSMTKAFNNNCTSAFLNLPVLYHCNRELLLIREFPIKRKDMSSLTTATLADESSETSSAPKLTKETANSLVMKLTDEERVTLLNTLQQFESEQLKAEYKGQLAAFRWRTKLGRPSKVPRLGDVDPTGSFCPVPEDWLMKKYAETVPKPTGQQLFGVGVHNAVPFIGFGFLDNFLMIICGDYIELTLGSFMVLSTMAAAALGNTFSDVLGLGCASYVESFAAKIGVKAPPLSPIQLDMKSSRTCANIGDYIELTLGSFMTLSTMAAAALGNTMGDVLGLGCAGYVEALAAKIGVKAPSLSPIQLNMKQSRMFANLGRGIGVTIGCLLGMLPLLFMKNKDEAKKDNDKESPDASQES